MAGDGRRKPNDSGRMFESFTDSDGVFNASVCFFALGGVRRETYSCRRTPCAQPRPASKVTAATEYFMSIDLDSFFSNRCCTLNIGCLGEKGKFAREGQSRKPGSSVAAVLYNQPPARCGRRTSR